MTASLCCFYEQLSVALFKKSDRFRRTERISAIFSDFQAIFSDFQRFSKNNIVCNPAAEKCQRFTEICLTNLWGMGKKWDSVQTPMSLFFVIYAKKSSFRERFSFSDFQRFWKSLKIADRKFEIMIWVEKSLWLITFITPANRQSPSRSERSVVIPATSLYFEPIPSRDSAPRGRGSTLTALFVGPPPTPLRPGGEGRTRAGI